MKALKTLLLILLAAVLLIAGAAALFWKQLLSPEQKIHYGLYSAAAEDYHRAVRISPESTKAQADYVDSLVTMGNLGRALYLSELYGIENDRLPALREVVEKCLSAEANNDAYALGDDPAVQATDGLPVREALRWLEGYQHALLGDWASAKNYFAAIDAKILAEPLRPYQQYYLARSYRIAGSEEEQTAVEELLLGLTGGAVDDQLAMRARYNLIAWDLDRGGADARQSADRLLLAIDPEVDPWAYQKSCLELADYCLSTDDLAGAWEYASRGLAAEPATATARSAAEKCLEILKLSPTEQSTGFELPENLFSGLATAGADKGLAGETAAALLRIKSERELEAALLGELYVALSACYRAAGDAKALAGLVASSSFAGFTPEQRAQVLFNSALLLKQREQWNMSLEYLRKAAALDSPLAGEAEYESYTILKQVQTRLDPGRARQYLGAVIEKHPDSPALFRAAEELVPLEIFEGGLQAAAGLCDRLLKLEPQDDTPAAQRDTHQLHTVARYWKAYIAGQQGSHAAAESIRGEIGTKYWNYYELTSEFPPRPQLAAAPGLLTLPEHAGEYLLGLGQTESARELFDDRTPAEDQLLIYLDLRNRELTATLATRQWEATRILESGRITEQPLLDYLLNEAYPRPYRDFVSAAAREFNVSEALIYAIMKKESTFKEDAVSWVGAQGLMQVMPNTAQWINGRYGLKANTGNLKDPATSIRLGAAYIRSLLDDLGENNIRGVIHSYNGGPGNYNKWREAYPCDQILFTDVVPNEQNETYAKLVLKYYKIYEWLGARD